MLARLPPSYWSMHPLASFAQSVASFFTQGARGHVWGIPRAVFLLLFFVSLPVFDALQALLWGGGYIGEVSAVGTFRVDAARGLRVLSCTSSRECTLDLSRALPSLSAVYCTRCVTCFFRCLVAFPIFDLLRVVEGDEGVVFGGGHIRRRDVLHREAERGDCARLLPLRIFFALSPISNLRHGECAVRLGRGAPFILLRGRSRCWGSHVCSPPLSFVLFTISQDARRRRDVCADVDCICGRRADAYKVTRYPANRPPLSRKCGRMGRRHRGSLVLPRIRHFVDDPAIALLLR
ncbi:hypothetical protein B0H14DRAFT_365599 [Mycena olivaceomarginata]|nr:hypothetical protein B0H14DRAFT_365599 [Mycena olivaceomarginata]